MFSQKRSYYFLGYLTKLDIHISARLLFDTWTSIWHLDYFFLQSLFTLYNYYYILLPVVYTVEFQKRGLPHAHILLWFAEGNKLISPEDIDEIISAEIPDEQVDPVGYKAVSQFMVHGPCGAANPRCPCMSKGRCTKYYPKTFRDKTTMDDDGYAFYRRRDTKRTVECNNILFSFESCYPINEI